MRDYPIRPVPFTHASFEDGFWRPRLDVNRRVTLPAVLERCEKTGRVDNFKKAAGAMQGKHEGREFNDTDVYKAIEGASYSLLIEQDPALAAALGELVDWIRAAQEADGYIYTARTVDPTDVDPDLEGEERWSNLRWSHELYCLGHLYEAAVAYGAATGNDDLLEASLQSARLIDDVFGADGRHDVPGHQEVEIGLAKLYRATGEERWLELARFFLDQRGRHDGRSVYDGFGILGYSQDHAPVSEQREAVGHAVRAGYQYAAMADMVALAGATEYLPALESIWNDVVGRKLYLTGGIGAVHHGEAFGPPYDLPNATAYNETCAAVANVLWNHRMFLLHGHAKYVDVMERTLYNGFASGVSLGGAEFFYANPLEFDGEFAFNVEGESSRCPWFEVSCCPGNVIRFLPSLPAYAYAGRGDTAYVNLFVAGEGRIGLDGGDVRLRQRTEYPWDGRIELEVVATEVDAFSLSIRVPGWSVGRPVPSDLYRYAEGGGGTRGPRFHLNGEPVEPEIVDGFAVVTRNWRAGDRLVVELPMKPRRVLSHPAVEADRDKVAVERGPILYCAEAVDNQGSALDLTLDDGAPLVVEYRPDLLGGVRTIRAGDIMLIPYYAWSHREKGEMSVWLQRGRAATRSNALSGAGQDTSRADEVSNSS